jgi:hypothetical protein
MPALREIQADFSRAVLHGDRALEGWIKPNGLSPAQRLAVYRNNTLLGLAEALRDGYPVLNSLVGEDFFKRMAQHYCVRHPPSSGCLLVYGGSFPRFVADYQPAQGLPYLADVARLEWLWQEAFHAAEAEPLNLSALAAVPPECQGGLRFRLHPTARLLDSRYPVLRIWETNQQGFAGEGRISLDEGGCRLLVFRPSLTVEIHALGLGDYVFLSALAQAETIAAALALALAEDAGFDLPACLGRWLGDAVLTEFY